MRIQSLSLSVGFYCPEQSSDPHMYPCADVSTYCPIGTGAPLSVQKGYYSVQPENEFPPFPGAATEAPCEPGYYCPYDVVQDHSTGLRLECPGGRYGDRFSELLPSCTGECEERYYCPSGSTTPQQFPCGEDAFCPAGSSEASSIEPGYYVPDGLVHAAPQQYICPPGSYCINGTPCLLVR